MTDDRDQQNTPGEPDAEDAADAAAALNADMVLDPSRERPDDAPSGEDVLPNQEGVSSP